MHPIDLVLAREGKEHSAKEREYYTNMHQQLHRDLRDNILTCPPEFLTRRLALFFMHQHNTTLVCPSVPPTSTPAPTTPSTPVLAAVIKDDVSSSTPTAAASPLLTLNEPALPDTTKSAVPTSIKDTAAPITTKAPTITSTVDAATSSDILPSSALITAPLALSNATPQDFSFCNALTLFHQFDHKTQLIDTSLHSTAKKFIFASPEQQEEVEYILLAAEKLQLAVYHVKEALLDVLFRELESDEGGIFEEMMRKICEVEGGGVVSLIEGLCRNVLEVVGEVEVPESESGSERGESSDGDYCPSEDSGEDDEDESMIDEPSSSDGERDAGWRVDMQNLEWAVEHRSSEHHEHHKHKTLNALQFLETAKAMIASLTQPELWAVLDECRKIMELSTGRKFDLPASLLNDRPGLEKSGTYHPGGLGDAVVGALISYRHHVIDNGETVNERVYQRAHGFFTFVQERNEVVSGVSKERRWSSEDGARRHEKHHANCECSSCGRQLDEKKCSGNCVDECICVVTCMLIPTDDEFTNLNAEDEGVIILFEEAGSRALSPINEEPEAEAESEGAVREGQMFVMTEDGEIEDIGVVEIAN